MAAVLALSAPSQLLKELFVLGGSESGVAISHARR